MIVHNLIETKEFFTEETKADYFVIYEKFENTDAIIKGCKLEENDCGTEEIVQILHGNEECSCSLKNVKSYRVGEQFKTIEEILSTIKENHKNIFQ